MMDNLKESRQFIGLVSSPLQTAGGLHTGSQVTHHVFSDPVLNVDTIPFSFHLKEDADGRTQLKRTSEVSPNIGAEVNSKPARLP